MKKVMIDEKLYEVPDEVADHIKLLSDRIIITADKIDILHALIFDSK